MLYEIEKLNYMISDTSEVDWTYVDEVDISPQRLSKIIDHFLLSLLPEHNLPGSDWFKLQGIAIWIKQDKLLTDRQRRYAIVTMALNWNELDITKVIT
jgi:hypothetical protein